MMTNTKYVKLLGTIYQFYDRELRNNAFLILITGIITLLLILVTSPDNIPDIHYLKFTMDNILLYEIPGIHFVAISIYINYIVVNLWTVRRLRRKRKQMVNKLREIWSNGGTEDQLFLDPDFQGFFTFN